MHRFEMYQDTEGKWRWRLFRIERKGDPDIIACSGQGWDTRNDAFEETKKVRKAILDILIREVG